MSEQVENIIIDLFKLACGDSFSEVDFEYILNICKLFEKKQTRLIVMSTLFNDYLKTKLNKNKIVHIIPHKKNKEKNNI